MKSGKSMLLIILGALLLLQCLLPSVEADDNDLDAHNVLFLSAYSENFITTADELEGARSVLDTYGINLDTEFMDSKRFPDPENTQNFYQSLRYKLDNGYAYDGVIVSDDAALQFVMDYQNDLFAGIPIYFIAINDYDRATQASQNPLMTGVYEKAALKDNIDLALQMIPQATHIVGIVDGTVTGIGDGKQFTDVQKYFPDLTYTLLRSSDYTFGDLADQLQRYNDVTVILFFTMSADKNGTYLNMNQQFAFVSENANVPVFRISVGGVGKGLLGGKMIDYREFGVRAAKTMVDIFEGASIANMGLDEATPYYYYFDYEMIEKYGIDESKLPAGSVLLNQKLSIWDQYKDYIIGTGVILIFLLLLAIVLAIDNMKRRKVERKLLCSNTELNGLYQKYETAVSGTNSAVWEMNVETMTIEISNSFEKIFGKTIPNKGSVEVIFNMITDPESAALIEKVLKDFISCQRNEIYLTVPLVDETAKKRWLLIKGSGVYDLDGKLTDIAGIFLDISSEKERTEYIEHFAKHDFLTGLPNRLAFQETLQKEIDSGHCGSLVMFDVDDFKSINDTLGHSFGDEILKQIADRLRLTEDENIYVARMGGDEFFIILRNLTDQADIINCIEDLYARVSAPFNLDGIIEYLNFSMGVTIYPADNNNIDQLMMNVDTAMYHVKRNGKNNYQFYKESMKKELKEKKEIEMLLRQAVEEESFEIYYQPLVDVKSGDICAMEALIRLKDFNISPGIFIPIAEETGDIVAIGRWVVKEAILQMVKWKENGLPEKRMAINYSAKQMSDHGYLCFLKQLVTEYGISADNIEIEVTEGILMEKTEANMDFLKEIRRLGFRLALDDFGSGYSSLSYLTFLPVNKIKLDKSVNDKFLDMENCEVMQSIISLAHSLNLSITAEGIEEWSQFSKLKKCGCDTVQGYLFAKPMPAGEIEEIYSQTFVV